VNDDDKARAAHFAAIKVSQASEAICAWWDKANPTICEHCGKPPHEMAVNNEDLTELMHLISNLYAANTAHRNTTT